MLLPYDALKTINNVLSFSPNNIRANAYKTIILQGLGKESEADELIGFGKLIQTTELRLNTCDQNLVAFNEKLKKWYWSTQILHLIGIQQREQLEVAQSFLVCLIIIILF